MGKRSDDELYQDRYKIVVKSNELIQKSRFDLTLQQQKIILYLISQINPWDEDFKLYKFNIKDFCKICGIENNWYYIELKNAIQEIANKSLWIKLPSGTETLVRWIEKPYINANEGTIEIKLDDDMKPYLLLLKKNFTRYELFWILMFNSKYSIRLYEVIKSFHYNEDKDYIKSINLEELKIMLGAGHYTDYRDFRRRVLEKAISEINKYSDKIIEYKPIRKGKTIEVIEFTIKTKETMARIKLYSEIEKELGFNQLTLWEILEENNLIEGKDNE